MHRGTVEHTGDGNRSSQDTASGSRIDRYIVWPGHTADTPDDVYLRIYAQMVEEGRDKTVFYDGSIINERDFLSFIRAPGILPLIVWDTKRKVICFLAWLSHEEDGWAKSHFCGLGPYYRGVGEAVLDTWRKAGMVGVLGVIPAWNKSAQALVDHLGFKRCGAIPQYCYSADDDKRHSGLVYHKLLGENHGKRRRR